MMRIVVVGGTAQASTTVESWVREESGSQVSRAR